MAGLAGLASAELTLEETVRLLIDGFIALHRDNPRLHRALSAEVPISVGQRERIEQICALAITILAEVLQEKVEGPQLKAAMMIDAVDALTHRWFVDEHGNPARPDDLARELQKMVCSYVTS